MFARSTIGAIIFALALIAEAPALAFEATTKEITEKSDTAEVTLAYPQFGIASIDSEVEAFAKQKHAEFKEFFAERSATDQPYSTDLSFEIARNDDQMLEVLFTHSYYFGGAHPNMNRYSFNYLMPSAARVYVPELFTKEGFKRVSELAIADLKPKLTGPDGMADAHQVEMGAGPFSDNFHAFVLTAEELAIYFDPYQVAAYAAGPQEVHIPLTKLNGRLRTDPTSPLPSFDCAKASTEMEEVICADPAVARLDREVADAYAWRLAWAQPEEKPGLKQTQRDWLAERDKTCGAVGGAQRTRCLSEHYGARLKVLRMA